MGCRIIRDTEEDYSVLYDSVTMHAFGPIFYGSEKAEEFLRWVRYWKENGDDTNSNYDPRAMSDQELEDAYSMFVCAMETKKEGQEYATYYRRPVRYLNRQKRKG